VLFHIDGLLLYGSKPLYSLIHSLSLGRIKLSGNNVNAVLRGALVSKHELIAFFKFLDEHTEKKYQNLPFYDKKSTLYGEKTKFKGYRPTLYGTITVATKRFSKDGEQLSKMTIYKRIRDFPNGVKDDSQTANTGVKSVVYGKFEATPTFKLIKENIGADPNSVKNHLRAPDRFEITYKKQGKYIRSCYLAWRAMGAKVDLLDASLEQWALVWGKDPKTPMQCNEKMRDSQTGLIAYGYTTALRWAMKHSHDEQVRNKIITGDNSYRTTNLKRTAGQHKRSYFTEEQCFLLPYAIYNVDTLGLTFSGIILGGRMCALTDFTPARFDITASTIDLWESKVQKWVTKPLFAHELAFFKQFIDYMNVAPDKPLFARSHTEYNKDLKKIKHYFAGTEHAMHWTPTTHTAFKHTCVSQMSLHGVSIDVISDYIGTDANTLKQFYRGGGEKKIRSEIGGEKIEQQKVNWREFVIALTYAFAKRFKELTGVEMVLPPKEAS